MVNRAHASIRRLIKGRTATNPADHNRTAERSPNFCVTLLCVAALRTTHHTRHLLLAPTTLAVTPHRCVNTPVAWVDIKVTLLQSVLLHESC